MECLESCLDAIHLQKVDSAFLSPSKHTSGQKCLKWASRSQNPAFRCRLPSKSGIDFFDVILAAKHYMYMRGKTKFIIAGLLIVAAVVYLIVSSTGGTARYFLTIEELQAMGDEANSRNITVSGAVLGDTIVYDSSAPQVTFTIVQMPGDPEEVERAGGLAAILHAAVSDPNAPRLAIVYDDVKPDLLQHEAQAIIRGQLGQDGRFYADEVLLKCPTRYEEEIPDQAGE